jgi:hypothetical protein
MERSMKTLVRAFCLLPLLSSCTTLEALSGEEPTTFRALYVQTGHAVESGDNTVGLALTTRLKDQWAGDIQLDRFDEDRHLISLGIRYFFTQEHPVQPFFGVGLAILDRDKFAVTKDGYVRVGLEWAQVGPWRLGFDWRSYAEDQNGDRLLAVSLGWAW